MFDYHAFMSYSHAADSQFAPFLQGAVQRFARPWYRLRTIRIFRDQTGLAMTPGLWPDIQKALDGSGAFILLASPQAAASQWVQREIEHWLSLQRGPPLLVLTEGSVAWNAKTNDFDWKKTTALPLVLSRAYASEPKHLDAADLKAGDLSPRHAKIRSAAAEIYSRLTGRPLDEVIGEDVTQFRRNRATAAVAVLLVLASAAGILWFRTQADRQANIAGARRQLELARSAALISLQSNGGPGALNIPRRDAARAAMLGAESLRLVPTADGADALRAHFALTPHRAASHTFEPGFVFAALSRNGQMGARRGTELAISTPARRIGVHTLPADAETIQLALADSGMPFRLSQGNATPLASADPLVVDTAATTVLAPDGARYATVRKRADSSWEIALHEIGKPNPSYHWSASGMSMPIAFSSNGAYLAFPNGGTVTVARVADGNTWNSLPSDLVEIQVVAVDDGGGAVLVHGWKPDPATVIVKNYQVQTLPAAAGSMFRRVYSGADENLEIRDLAIDVQARLVAMGGEHGWVRVMDYLSGNTLAVIRSDDLRAWTLTRSSGTPEVVTASASGGAAWAISREPAEAARPSIERPADIGPQAAMSAFGERLFVSGMHRTEPRQWFLSASTVSGPEVTETTIGAAPETLLASPAGRYVSVTDHQRRTQVRSLPTLGLVWQPPAEQVLPVLLAFSADDRFLAWGAAETGIRLVDLATRQSRSISGPVPGLVALAASAAGAAVAWAHGASSSECHCVSITLWGASAGFESLAKLHTRGDGANPLLTFDRNGKRLAGGISDGTVSVWNIDAPGAPSSYLQDGALTELSFNADGRYLITRGTGRMARSQEQQEVAIWDAAEGRKVWRHLAAERIAGVAMSADARHMLIAKHATLRSTGNLGIRLETLLWQPEDLLRLACKRYDYDLSTEERAAFLPGTDSGAACGKPDADTVATAPLSSAVDGIP